MKFSGSKKTRAFICLAIALVTFGIYGQVRGFGFVNFDDPYYVTENPIVTQGISFKGIVWAFTHFYASNWHPLTWISHMLDCQLFGVNPGGPHIVNVLIHAANAILLFLLLQRLTGAQWRSAIVAGLFAWHPLHVESVAWISERKDVLSTFFGLLSLLAYVTYVNESKVQSPKSKTWYCVALGLFVLSLLAKPMLVTLPFVMLLLDIWPLKRIEDAGWRKFFPRPFARLVKEKLPWLVLMVASCLVTLSAQVTAAATTNRLPIPSRLINAAESYFWYVEKMFWPTRLAAYYPFQTIRPLGPLVLIVAGLFLISLASVITIRRWPFLFVGWFWFVGTLIPVIGFVQVGSQGMADRYSYFPLIGLFIAIVWAAQGLLNRSRAGMAAGALAAIAVLAALAVTAFFQIRYWKSTLTLFSHAVAVTPDNDTALAILGTAFYDAHRDDDAMTMYKLSARLNPHAGDVHYNMGLVLARRGDTNGALQQYEEAVKLTPEDPAMQTFLAKTLAERGKPGEALPHYAEAARLQPDNAEYQNALAVCLVALGRRADALDHYRQAAALEPGNAYYQNNFATALFRAGENAAAVEHYRAAITADPKFAEPYSNLAAVYMMRGLFGDAANLYTQAVLLNPTNAEIRFNAGVALLRMQNVEGAMLQLAEAARLRPDWPAPLDVEAWTLATSPNDKVRRGAEAVKLAEKAADLTQHQQPATLLTLAAAYAEVGRFDDAIATANRALQLAKQSNQPALVERIERSLTLFQAHTPLRENTAGN